MPRIALLIIGMMLSIGCAHHRDPMPIAIQQAGDEALDCIQLQGEYCTNIEIAAEKIKKNQSDDVNDVLLGILVWPGMADLKNADGTEANALLDRCIWLKNMAGRKGCDTSVYPATPERYK